MTEFECFEECFFMAIDSWFTADIACCDNCHDEFLNFWPHADSANNKKFQKSSIPLDVFYSGSKKLQECYTEKEFNKYIKRIRCLRCGNYLTSNIWAYNLPFFVPEDFEKQLVEIANIADSAPFLLLSHPLANQVYRTLKQIGSDLNIRKFPKYLYRARKVKDKLIRKSINSFDFPPKESVSEGRYNHSGKSVLYLASDSDTCFKEMRCEPCIIAEIQINKKAKILDLSTPDESHEKYSDLLSQLAYSMLLSAKQPNDGWYKPKYVFSRFVADCARDAGIQAIKYPSTRITKNNFNIVILDPSISIKNNGRITNYTNKP